MSNSCAGSAGVYVFVRWIEISRNGEFQTYEFERFERNYDEIYLTKNGYYFFVTVLLCFC